MPRDVVRGDVVGIQPGHRYTYGEDGQDGTIEHPLLRLRVVRSAAGLVAPGATVHLQVVVDPLMDLRPPTTPAFDEEDDADVVVALGEAASVPDGAAVAPLACLVGVRRVDRRGLRRDRSRPGPLSS